MSVALLLLCSLLTCGCCHDVMSIEQLTYAVGKLDRKVEALEEDKVKLTLKLQLLEQKMENPNRMCGCPKPVSDFKPHSCADDDRLLDKTNGVRTLNVNGRDITVYCDQTTSGGGWTVFQRRFNGSVVFDQDWTDYEDGFGHVSGEYWLGLRNIYRMTSRENYTLRVDLEDFSGATAYAEYSDFSISGPEDNYRLHVSSYSGTAGNDAQYGMINNSNMQFTTRDRDHDLRSDVNCDVTFYRGGFWYKDCGYLNPNGVYKNTAVTDQTNSMSWYPWRDYQALRRVEMKIRPA